MDSALPKHELDMLQPLASISPGNDVELSDQQIYQLLKDAKHRLGSTLIGPSKMSASQNHSSISSLQKCLSTGLDNSLPTSYITMSSQGALVDSSLLITAKQRKLVSGARTVEDLVQSKSNKEKAKLATAGTDWYNIPRTKLSLELKRDLQLLRLRSVLDPKRHFKKENRKTQVPEFSQIGTIIEGPTEFFSARLTKKDRRRTFVEEVLAGEKATHRFKSKYNDIQKAKTSGKKAYYKNSKAKRTRRSSSG